MKLLSPQQLSGFLEELLSPAESKTVLKEEETPRQLPPSIASLLEPDSITPQTRTADAQAEAQVAHEIELEEFQRRRQAILPQLFEGSERYRFGSELARGGMGRVMEAEDENLRRPVAIKLLIRGAEEQLGLQLRFTEEAQITGQLQHPNIVPVYDLGCLEDGQLYFSMKRVRGRTLREILKGHRRGKEEMLRCFPQSRLLHAFQQICMAIAYAHSRSVVHRDLKPSNIMFGDFGEVLVMDWGLAKIMERGKQDRVKSHREGLRYWATRHGEVIGTPGYMPPELALGQLDEIDGRSDIFSLGAILYEILSLQAPWSGQDLPLLLKQMLQEPLQTPRERSPDRSIPEALERICLCCLQIDPEARFSTVMELHDSLQSYLDGALEQERRSALVRRQLEEAQRHIQDYERLEAETLTLEAKVEQEEMERAPWDGIERRRPLWALKDQLYQRRRSKEEAFTLALHASRLALNHSGGAKSPKKALSKLYWSAFLQAERQGDRGAAIHYKTLLEKLGLKSYARPLRGDGRLSIETDPPGAQAVLFSYEERDKILSPSQARVLGHTPTRVDPLAMGSYLLVLRLPGLRDTQIPVHLERLTDFSLKLRLRSPEAVRPGFVYIPGGEFPVGGSAKAALSLPAQKIRLQDLCIARLPVSCRQYLEFLNESAGLDLQVARQRMPRLFPGGAGLFVEQKGRFSIPASDPAGLIWDPNWPIFGINYADALAYCAWRGARDQLPYRLPGELEWEVAARGADRRHFPWGQEWVPTYCMCAQSRPGPARLEACGSFPQDRSPFGVMDLAGGVSDWTESSISADWAEGAQERVVKGGSWNHLDLFAQAASRQLISPDSVSVSIGFRLAYDFS